MLEFEEVRQAAWAYALGAGSIQQHPVGAGEVCGVAAEHGAGQDVPPRPVGTGTVQGCPPREDAAGRPGEQPGQRRAGLRSLVRGGAAEAPVIDKKRCGETEQSLDRQERDLPAARDWTAREERPELLSRLAD